MSELAQESPVLKPVAADSPTGQWVRYEPEFDELKAEMDKIADLRANEVDWNKVVTLSTEILGSKSKDLLVASWYCLGMFHKKGYPGLAEGLSALNRLSSSFWDTLFPETKRMRARVSAVEWLNERVAQAVEQRKPGAADRDALQGCLSAVDGLGGVLAEKLAGEAPSLGDMTRSLKARNDEIKVAPQAAAPAAPGGAPPAAASVAIAAPVPAAEAADLSSPESIQRSLNKIWATFRNAATNLRRARPQDPTAYRLARLGAWMPMQQLPPATDGKTRMQPMGASPALSEQFDGMASQSDWSTLLEQAETQFEKSVLWLDAQRYVCMALDGLSYNDALLTVKSECALLIDRFPGLVALQFSNETPFASEDTKTWLRTELGGGGGGAGGGAADGAAPAYVPAGEEDEEIVTITAEAQELVKQKQPGPAAALLREAVNHSVSRRQAFRRRLELARFLVEIKEHRAAVAQLECLDGEIARYRLEEWDPNMAAQVLGMYVACQQQLLRGEWKGMPQAGVEAEKVFSRLARIDAAAALNLQKK